MAFMYPLVSGTFGLIIVLGLPVLVQAETKTIVSEATYSMGDGETPSSAEAMVLQKAKQRALEEAGTYVASYTRVHNFDLSEEEIVTVAGGILRAEILERKRTVVGDGISFFIKIKAEVTTAAVEEWANRVKGKHLGEDYQKLLNDYSRLAQEFSELKARVKEMPPGLEREEILDQIREREKSFAALQENEAVFFRRIVSGEELFSKAASELANKQARRRDLHATLDKLFKEIKERGHLVQVGAPNIETDVHTPESATLILPVVVKANKANRKIASLIERLNGIAFDDGEAGGSVQGFLDDLDLVVEVTFRDGSSERRFCYDCLMYSARSSIPFIEVIGGTDNRQIKMVIPFTKVKQINQVRGYFKLTEGGKDPRFY